MSISITVGEARIVALESGEFYVCMRSNDSILAYCTTREEAEAVVDTFDLIANGIDVDTRRELGSTERAEYLSFVNSRIDARVGFTKRQAEDLKAGYSDGFGQGVMCALGFVGIKVRK